jgi:hypothetical protein
MKSHGGTRGEETAAEVKRVPCVSIGARDGEDFLLVEEASGIGANSQAEQPQNATEKNRPGYRPSEQKDDQSKKIAEANTPARKKVGGGHALAPRRRCTAS